MKVCPELMRKHCDMEIHFTEINVRAERKRGRAAARDGENPREVEERDRVPATGSARQLGLSLPNTATAPELFNACVAHGGKGWDHSAMMRALEKLANFEIGQQA
jgi:hypothetical protein